MYLGCSMIFSYHFQKKGRFNKEYAVNIFPRISCIIYYCRQTRSEKEKQTLGEGVAETTLFKPFHLHLKKFLSHSVKSNAF